VAGEALSDHPDRIAQELADHIDHAQADHQKDHGGGASSAKLNSCDSYCHRPACCRKGKAAHMRQDINFSSGQDQCEGWLYRPEEMAEAAELPLIVMSARLSRGEGAGPGPDWRSFFPGRENRWLAGA